MSSALENLKTNRKTRRTVDEIVANTRPNGMRSPEIVPDAARCEVVIEPGRSGCSGAGEDEDDAECRVDGLCPGVAVRPDAASALNVPYELMAGIIGSRIGVGETIEEPVWD